MYNYGRPATLNKCVAVHPVAFVIQAKDVSGANRTCGMDEFEITVSTVTPKKDKELVEVVEDLKIDIVDQKVTWHFD